MTVLPTGNSGNYFADQQRHSRRFEWNELWSLKPMTGLGMHKIQFGSSVASTNDEGQLHAKTITMFDGRSAKLRTIDFTPGSSFDRSDQQPAVFVQDHWTFNSHLAADAGIRAEAQTITATTRIAPRMGFIWSPMEGERTTVRGGIGAFYDSVPLNVYAFSHYLSKSSQPISWMGQ
jgi:TonB dependent receptor